MVIATPSLGVALDTRRAASGNGVHRFAHFGAVRGLRDMGRDTGRAQVGDKACGIEAAVGADFDAALAAI